MRCERDGANHLPLARRLHAAQMPWPHNGFFSSYDHASIRRGHQVYQQVCAACHSMNLIAYRNLVDVAYSEAEVKAMAEEVEARAGEGWVGDLAGPDACPWAGGGWAQRPGRALHPPREAE